MPQMPTIDEDALRFHFPAGWGVVKYDQQADPATGQGAGFYRRVMEKGGVAISAVDFVCRVRPARPARLVLIEVKDDRLRVKPTGERHNELYHKVLLKVLDTLAGLTVAERLKEASLRPMACLSKHPEVEVVLFLVEPPPSSVPVRVGNAKKLRKLTKIQRVSDLDQRLTAKLRAWGLPFRLYNLTNRLPVEWSVVAIP